MSSAEKVDFPIFEALKLTQDVPLADTPALVNNDHKHLEHEQHEPHLHHHGHNVTVVPLVPEVSSTKPTGAAGETFHPSANTIGHHGDHPDHVDPLAPQFCIATEKGLVELHGESDMGYLGFAEAEEPFAGGLLSEVTLPDESEYSADEMPPLPQNDIATDIIPIFESNPDDFDPVDDMHNTHALILEAQ